MNPIRIKLKNFSSYDSIDFKFDFDSILILGEIDGASDRSNGAGKSSVFQGLSWLLTGNSKYKKSQDVIKRGKDFVEGELIFETGGEQFKIKRKRFSKANRKEIYLYEKDDNGEFVEIRGSTPTEVERKLKSLTKIDYDVFTNTSYFAQTSISQFVDSTPAKRQELIASILDFANWDSYKKSATDLLKEEKSSLDKLTIQLEEYKSIDEDLKRAKEDLVNSSKMKDELEGSRSKAKNDLHSIEEEFFEHKSSNKDLADIDSAKSKLAKVNSDISMINIVAASKNLSDLEEKLLQVKVSASSTKEKLLAAYDDLGNIPEFNLSEYEKKFVVGKTKYSEKLIQLNSLKEGGVCDHCGYDWGHDHSTHLDKKQEEVGALKAKLSRAENKLIKMRKEVSHKSDIQSNIDKLEKDQIRLESSIENLEFKIKTASEKLEYESDKLRKLETKKSKLEIFLEENSDVEGLDKVLSYINKRLDLAKSKLTEIDDRLKSCYIEIGSLDNKIESLKEAKKKRTSLKKDYNKVAKNVSVYKSLVSAFGRQGIQSVITDNVITEVEDLTNNLLSELSHNSISVKFLTKKADTNGDLKETLDIEITTETGAASFDTFSGGEKFRVVFAIRLALANIQANRAGSSVKILMLDEVSSYLDEHGKNIFISIIRRLEKDMKVMVITHDDSLKQKFNNVVYARKVKHNSVLSP